MKRQLLSCLVLTISLSACAGTTLQTQPVVSRAPNFLADSNVLFSSAVAATDSMGWQVVGSDSEQGTIEARSRDGGPESPSFYISLTKLRSGMTQLKIARNNIQNDELVSEFAWYMRRSMRIESQK